MPPEENKTQDTSQQDSAQAEPVVSGTPAFVEQPAESEPTETPIDIVPKITSEPPVEQISLEPASPEERPPSTPLPEDPPPTLQQAEPVETSPTPQPQIQEKIIYKTDPNIIQKLLIKARAKIQERKRKKLDKIMTLFKVKPQITNKDIQKLLRISRVSAFRYFNILEKQNRIKQVGNTGKSVFYTKI